MPRHPEQNAQGLLYRIDSSVDSSNDDSEPKGSGADAPDTDEISGADNGAYVEDRPSPPTPLPQAGEGRQEEATPFDADTPPPPNRGEELVIDEPKDVFSAIARVAYRGLVVDEESRKLIMAAIGKVQNAKVLQGNGKGNVVLDVGMVEDYAIWRVLLKWKWHGQFPTIRQVENELRYEFLPWYGNETNRNSLKKFKQRYPEWRQRLFAGDYVAFHNEVQDFISESRKQTYSPRKSSVVERHPWMGDDTDRQPEQISTTPELQQAAIRKLRDFRKKAE